MADFLFEIGLEEVPARMLAGAESELHKRVVEMLTRERLIEDGAPGSVISYSTPRRLAVWVRGVLEQQSDVTEEVMGPAVKIAFKDGVPGPAAEAFAKKSGVSVSELRRVDTPKGEYIAVTTVKRGRSASEVIANELPKELAAIYWAKNMYWRAGKPERFVRPVEWMVALLGEAVVPVSFGGKVAGRASYGHRVLSSGEAFEVVAPESYAAQLRGEFVEPDVEVRRHTIRKALDHVTREVSGARWREDVVLVDAVTHLTEWPTVLMGSFEAEYLALPEEVLVTVMRDHQKYFAVEFQEADSSAALRNDKPNRLAPHFLTVLNITTDERTAGIIRQGNERVLRARFNDARFFWEFDQRVPLTERVKLLENVTFQKDLGSYAAKSERVRSLAAKLVGIANERGAKVDAAVVEEAARLAKTDLTTELVKEFTELQGVIGGLYAKAASIDSRIADAIYDQYLPASASDAVPRSAEGAVLGLADRMDTIAGMFGLGMEPTGSKDPFALRRAANAVVRILAESGLPLTLSDALGFHGGEEAVAAKMGAFFRERVEFYLRDVRGNAYDTVAAVMAAGYDDLRDVAARAQAVTAVRSSADFAAVSAAFKRMKNILAQAGERGDSATNSGRGGVHLAERDLMDAAEQVRNSVNGHVSYRNYILAFQEIATLRPFIDRYFDEVMILDPNPIVRGTRLYLLGVIVSDIRNIADLSEIVTER